MGGIAAQYRVGPSDFFTSDDLEADANTLKGQIAVLDDLDWGEPVSQALFDSWNGYVADFNRFYSSTFVTNWIGAGWNNSNRDELVQLERRYVDFVQRWGQESRRPIPGGVVNPSSGTEDNFSDHLKKQLGDLVPGAGTWTAATILIALVVGFFIWREFA